MNDANSPGRQLARGDLAAAVPQRDRHAEAAESSISGGRLDSAAVTFMFVRNR